MFNEINTFSSCCGHRFQIATYPRVCPNCGNQFWDNPIPVVLILQPIEDDEGHLGLVLIRRAIQPCVGQLALPGGFLEYESWQEGAARELREEGVRDVHPSQIRPFYPCPFLSSMDNRRLLIITAADTIPLMDFPPFVPNREVSERVIIWEQTPCCFPSHTQAVRSFFEDT